MKIDKSGMNDKQEIFFEDLINEFTSEIYCSPKLI